MAGIIVRIFIAVVIAQVLHQFGRRIADMQRHRQIAGLLHGGDGIVDAQVGTVALGTSGKIHHRLGKGDSRLGPSYLHHRIEGGIRQQQGVGIRQSHILARTDYHSAGNELRVFASFYHARHPIERRIGVAATDALDEGGDDVIVHIALLVVSKGILLKLFFYHLVGDDHLIRFCRFHHQFQDIEELPGIAAAEPEHRRSFLQIDLLLREFHVLGDGTLQESLQIFLFQGFEHVELASGEQRTDYLERGVLGGGTNQGNDALLHCAQQGVLLTLGEAVDFVYKQDR